MNIPIISICCITYNHEEFIRDALDGFLMQETNFPFEVLIHDDASTDNTADIIREYEAKYPDIIKPIYQTGNQYSKGVRISSVYNFPRVKGKYIAICEGDDYWTDPHKLQKQVDFLEKNSDYVMCFHQAEIKSFNGRKLEESWKKIQIENREYGVMETYKNWCIFTASVLFRTKALDLTKWNEIFSNPIYNKGTDVFLWLHLAKDGRFRGMKDNMSVYRVHPGGVSASLFDFFSKRSKKDIYLESKAMLKDFSHLHFLNKIAYEKLRTFSTDAWSRRNISDFTYSLGQKLLFKTKSSRANTIVQLVRTKSARLFRNFRSGK